jgi:hypothetical protein
MFVTIERNRRNDTNYVAKLGFGINNLSNRFELGVFSNYGTPFSNDHLRR